MPLVEQGATRRTLTRPFSAIRHARRRLLLAENATGVVGAFFLIVSIREWYVPGDCSGVEALRGKYFLVHFIALTHQENIVAAVKKSHLSGIQRTSSHDDGNCV